MDLAKAIDDERAKIRRLRTIVDLTASMLYQANLSEQELRELIAATKKAVLHLFPDKEETYELIYKPRFERILRERINSTEQERHG